MRKLTIQDAFDLTKIAKKAGLKDSMQELFKKGKLTGSEENIEEFGAEFIVDIMFGCAVEGIDNDICSLIGRIANKEADEIRNMPLEDLMSIFKKIVEENNIMVFIRSVSKFMK